MVGSNDDESVWSDPNIIDVEGLSYSCNSTTTDVSQKLKEYLLATWQHLRVSPAQNYDPVLR